MLPHLKKILLALAIVIAVTCNAQDQKKRPKANPVINIQFGYNYQVPGGDLKDRFGNNSRICFGGLYKPASNWTFALESGLLIGGIVKENTLLDDISTAEGQLIEANGGVVDYTLSQRGFDLFVKVGKIFPIRSNSPNSGFFIQAGGGFLQHRINITESGGTLPHLTKEIKKGYDRLSNGWALNQFVGYFHLDKKRLINFYIGLDLVQAFTENRRDFNFDTMRRDDRQRLDTFTGVRVGWMIPIYLSNKEDEFFFR